jgi:SagB-type dehydrogenase family enzyme
VDERIRSAPASIVLTGILWRSAWKYGERAYRHLQWDGGMMLAHTLAAAEASGLTATVLGAFIDKDVDHLIGVNGTREKALGVVPLGFGSSSSDTKDTGAGHPVPPLGLEPTPLSPQPIDYPEALRYHAASMLTDADGVRHLRRASFRVEHLGRRAASVHSLPPPTEARGDPGLDAVIRRRRSTRRFAQSPISLRELATILEKSTRGFPADFVGPSETLLETYLIVNAIRGIEPGAYYYNRGSHRLDLLKPGEFRGSASFLCLDQALARDASAVLYYLTDLDALAGTFGERGYRLAELEAGLVAGRAYLATYAIGRGATGLTFYDDEVSRFFSPHAAGFEPLLAVAIGVPRRRS